MKTKKINQADEFQSVNEPQNLTMGKRMDSWLKVGSFNKKDEYYTPAIMVYPIMEYLQEGTTIWCPFDTEKSEFVRVFTAAGFNVIHSHIWDGKDFFKYEPSEPYDYVISNPPITRKLDVLRRLYDLNKPLVIKQRTQAYARLVCFLWVSYFPVQFI